MSYFKVPLPLASMADKEHILISWKMRYEFPLKQERNRQEVKALFRVMEVLLIMEMETGIRDALVSILSRCEEILLLESHGSTYATTWANQVNLRSEEAPAIASAHRAALIATGRSTPSSRNAPGKPCGRPAKRSRHSNGGTGGQA
jgi:hypothetical protein